ncbi:hypothetical protein CVT43_08640 [Enterococcus faecalis OG1RF]|nr:hypothetical protein CVT43_08640 [Enterococcus faecalis OG1RF]AZV97236.1 hypothetical protein CVT44_08640 [Enterococcus faecalis]EGO8483065.1 hypothetical protein [Enterococcus faecalis]EGO8524098.1 hypothetical protein [Enterococcus faecalis]EGO8537003.1 hypothetical protein [Enterococcus faecalis]
MFFNFWRISAYFRRSCFCFRRLSIFKPGTKIQSDFCPRFFFTKKCQYSEKKKRFQFLFFFVCFTIIIETINDFFYAERSGYYVTTISKNYDSNRWF